MECGQIPRIDYGKFSAQLHSKAWSGRTLPVNGTIEVTQRCNLRCQHCYVPWAGRLGTSNLSPEIASEPRIETEGTALARAEVNRPPLSFDEICRILDDITEEGCLWLLITGGEPLMRPDFLDILDYAKRKGLLITLFTNATLMTDRIADHLAEYPPFFVEVTLYGATQATYETVTGVPGSYERCIQGIDMLLDRRIPLKLKTMALKANSHEIPQLKEFAETRGLKYRFDHMVHPRLDGDPEPRRTRLSPQEMVELDVATPKRAQAWRDLIDLTRGDRVGDRIFRCGAGAGNFHIDAYGYMQLCGFVRGFSYDLRQGSFYDGYRNYFSYVRGLLRHSSSECDDCALVNVCGICPAWQQIEGDGQEGPIDYIHRYAKLLSSALVVEAHTGCQDCMESERRWFGENGDMSGQAGAMS